MTTHSNSQKSPRRLAGLFLAAFAVFVIAVIAYGVLS